MCMCVCVCVCVCECVCVFAILAIRFHSWDRDGLHCYCKQDGWPSVGHLPYRHYQSTGSPIDGKQPLREFRCCL